MSNNDDSRLEIMAVRARQTKALADRDFETAAIYWTEDVTMRRGLGHAIAGSSEYKQMLLSGDSGDSPISYRRVPVLVDISSCLPLAYEEGQWTGHLGGPGGEVVIAGKYAAQWVKRAGTWLIRSEVFVALTCEGAGSLFEAVS